MEPRCTQLFFDPDKHPEDTLKAFDEFTQLFDLRYDAQFPDPPKVSMDAAMQRWKVENTTEAITDPKPNLQQFDQIRNNWRSKDRVAKFLGMYSSSRFFSDWRAAQPDEDQRKSASWDAFLTIMQEYYKPTENLTLKNFHFRELLQEPQETFTGFCNRVQKEAKHCQFKCASNDCTAESTAVRDQIVIGTHHNEIREEALKKSWDLTTLRKEGMKIESATRGGAEIAGESIINRLGKYSFSKLKPGNKERETKSETPKSGRSIDCFHCGNNINGSIAKHKEKCPAKGLKCSRCGKIGHFARLCKSAVNAVKEENEDEEKEAYTINLFQIETSLAPNKKDFKIQVVVNNHLGTVIADTGARISVCGANQAKQWGILDRMAPSRVKIKPYNSMPINVQGEARCAVSFGSSSIPVVWHIISGSCEPILAGLAAVQLGIIQFNSKPGTFQPVLMMGNNKAQDIQDCLAGYPENFTGIGKLKNYKVKLHVNKDKPVHVPPRSMPYHLKDRANQLIMEMIDQDVIEEHPPNEPAPWVSNVVLAPKADGSLRITLDARNVNKSILSTNLPIPRHEDIKAKLSGSQIFSKLDFKSAFWQLELEEQSRYLTVFHANDKLYRYKRLTMGIKPAQGELNTALQPLFAHIKNAHLIHDDLVIATVTEEDHIETVQQVMEVVKEAGLTLNPEKCCFAQKEINFWGMIYGSYGVRPDPEKLEALEHITPPSHREELISFLCMMQSNSNFIQNFSKKSATLRDMTKGKARFKWRKEHQHCFEMLLKEFKEAASLQYFDMSKPIYIYTDAHITGLGATLAQPDENKIIRPIAFASRTTKSAESRYPQLDLEAVAIDFGLRRFRNYIVGAPHVVTIVTDHKPLCAIFNGNRQGSIRTERIKLRHQDVQFKVTYQEGKRNPADYLSRRARPFEGLPKEEQSEVDDLNNLLYILHTTPIIDHIGLAEIAKYTKEDATLQEVTKLIQDGKMWISKKAEDDIRRFEGILQEISIAGNGILLKGDRLILPESLHLKAIQLAHRGSHPGQSGLERRLRYHFFFHHMFEKVKNFVQNCHDCQFFTDKKTRHPLKHHEVPAKCWESVAVDLFGPMPSSRHVVVVQDLASRFPAAKIVQSTKAEKVLPVLEEIYGAYGNPAKQLSDNGPPFNSKAMETFSNARGIQLQKISPLHPSSNPVETFMKPLGKAMKIANHNKKSEKEALSMLLQNYRDTPHPATGVSPGDMLFRDGMHTTFPRMKVTEKEIEQAREKDMKVKQEREEKLNASKYRTSTHFQVGDKVLIKNYLKTTKYQPVFIPEYSEVVAVEDGGRSVKIKLHNGKELRRHVDDVKPYRSMNSDGAEPKTESDVREESVLQKWHEVWNKVDDEMYLYEDESDDVEETYEPVNDHQQGTHNDDDLPEGQNGVESGNNRRSTRIRTANPRYINGDFVPR